MKKDKNFEVFQQTYSELGPNFQTLFMDDIEQFISNVANKKKQYGLGNFEIEVASEEM